MAGASVIRSLVDGIHSFMMTNSDRKREQLCYLQQFIDAFDGPEHHESMLLCDLTVVADKMKEWRSELPSVTPFYAVKSNPDSRLLELLNQSGANFDCASKGEIERILELGVSPDRIIYANTRKSISHIVYANHVGVQMTTIDCVEEIEKLRKYHPSAQLILRLNVDSGEKVIGQFGSKFGTDKRDIPEILSFLSKERLSLHGISFHIGSPCDDPQNFHNAIREARFVMDQLNDYGLPPISFIDIGGGFPGNDPSLFHKIALGVKKALEHFQIDVPVIAEPGRFFCAAPFVLVTPVIGARLRYVNDQPEQHCFLGDGVYSCFGEVYYMKTSLSPKVLRPVTVSQECLRTIIWGPTCDPADRVCEKIMMLPHLGLEDWLLFEDMCAYTVCMGTSFNGFPLPKILYID